MAAHVCAQRDVVGKDTAPSPAPDAAVPDAEVTRARRPSVTSIYSNSTVGSESYDIGEVMGRGSYGKVYRAWNKCISTECGVKVIEADSADNRETMLHKGLDHPNIVRLLETFEEDGHVYIAMELCNGGDLYQTLKDHGRFAETEARGAFAQVMRAVDFLHASYIAHRDIKLENFLLEKSGVPLAENVLKLIDFGFATQFIPGRVTMMTKCGSDGFVAPEVMYSRSYDERCDIFSCGVVLHCLVCGRMPFRDLPSVMKDPISFGGRGIKKSLTADVRMLIENMLCKTPDKRATARVALSSPWLRASKERAGSGWFSKSWLSRGSFSLAVSGNVGRITRAPQGLLAVVLRKSAKSGSPACNPGVHTDMAKGQQSKSGSPVRHKGSDGVPQLAHEPSERPQRLSL